MDGRTDGRGRGRWTMDREWSVGAGNCIRLHLNKDGSVQRLAKEGARNTGLSFVDLEIILKQRARNTGLSFVELEIILKQNNKSMPSN